MPESDGLDSGLPIENAYRKSPPMTDDGGGLLSS